MLKHYRYLITTLLVVLVLACSKDITESTTEKKANELSIQQAKKRFQQVQSEIQTQAKAARGKRSKKIIQSVLWEYAHQYTSTSGDLIVAVPAFFDSDLKMGKYGYRKLIYYTNKKTGKLEGFVAEYIPEEESFRNNFGHLSDANFTGQIIYYDEKGNYLNGIAVKNGMVTNRVVVALDGQVMQSPEEAGGKKAYYAGCEVLQAVGNCPVHNNGSGAAALPANLSNTIHPENQQVLDAMLRECSSVTLTLLCPETGGGGGGGTSGGTIYGYSPTTGGSYTPPTGPQPGGGGVQPGGYVLSDEQWMAIDFAGSDDRFTTDEKNYLLYNLWVAFALNEDPLVKDCLFKGIAFQTKAELIGCLSEAMHAVSGSGLTPQEQDIMVNHMNKFQIGLYVSNLITVHLFIEGKNWTALGYNRGGIGDGDHPNAIKHAMLACFNKSHLGATLARSLANAHEANQTLSTVNQNPAYGDDEAMNILMDLHNNEIGLTQVLPHFPGYGPFGAAELFDIFYPKAQNGELYVWIVKGQERSTVAKRTFNQ